MTYQRIPFTVATDASRSQERPTIAARDDGGFTVAWQNGGTFADNVTPAVEGANVSSTGDVEDTFAATGAGDRKQLDPSVTALDNGGYTLAWQDGETRGGPDSPDETTTIQADVHGPDGSITGILDIPGPGIDDQIEPAVTSLNDGGFAIAREGSAGDAQVTIHGAMGDREAEFRAADDVGIVQNNVDLTQLESGNMALVWEDFRTDGNVVEGAVITPAGELQSRFTAAEPDAGQQLHPTITARADGGFAIAWQEGDGFGESGDPTNISDTVRATLFSADGERAESLTVEPSRDGGARDNILPDIQTLANGDMALLWENSRFPTGDDPVQGRVLSPDGDTRESFTISNDTASDQERPKIAALENGGFATVWQDDQDPDTIEGKILVPESGSGGNSDGNTDTATFTGSVTGRWISGAVDSTGETVALDDPALGEVTVENNDADDTSEVFWGEGASVFDDPSLFRFDGAGSDSQAPFEVGTGPLFSLGSFEYENGITAGSSHDFGGGVLELNIGLDGAAATFCARIRVRCCHHAE